jgi:CBS domain containing-hemolysin-like protein
VWWLIAIAVLVLATLLASISLSLLETSRGAVAEQLERRGRHRLAQWVIDRLELADMPVSLLRTLFRLLFLIMVIVRLGSPAEDGRLALSPADLAIAGGISLFCIWLFTTVIASSIARYAGASLLAAMAPMLRSLAIILWPLTRAFGFIDEAVRRLSGATERERVAQAEEELLRSIEETHREGGLDEKAAALLENVVEFSSTDVGEVMTPRTDISGIEYTDDLAEIRAFIVREGHSRIPVFRDNLDNILGVLYVKDLMPYLGEDPTDFKLEPILRQPIFIPETKQVGELLADFQRSEVHLGIVIDEYGGTAGLVTIEDVLEEIVGEIHDEHDQPEDEEPRLDQLTEDVIEADGRYHIDDLNEALGLELPEEEEYDTIAGFMMATLGHVPATGETLISHGARLTAVETSVTHVQRVRVEVLSEDEARELGVAHANGERRRRFTNGGDGNGERAEQSASPPVHQTRDGHAPGEDATADASAGERSSGG